MTLLRSIARGMRSIARSVGIAVEASFDAARTTRLNKRHWQNADALSADAALRPAVRKVLRQRSRYETQNNGYAEGIVGQAATSLIGTGPQINITWRDEEANDYVEGLWRDWAEEIDLAGKLLLGARSKIETGEVFFVMKSNPRLGSPIKLDIAVVEADQIAHPFGRATLAEEPDGIEFDAYGNPLRYSILRAHPGSGLPAANEADLVDARFVLHWFTQRRPGQSRGYPDTTPSLSLFADLRRYRGATVQSAETAASIAGVLQTDSSVDDSDTEIAPLDTMPIESGTWMALPAGYKVGQLEPNQPTTTFGDFVRQLIREMARPFRMPFNIAAGDSSGYNYSSGRLDHQTYDESTAVERAAFARRILRRLFAEWLREAALVDPRVAQALAAERPRVSWIWPSRGHIDEVKSANADMIRINGMLASRTQICAERGRDFRELVREIRQEREFMASQGVSPADVDQALQRDAEDRRRDEEDERDENAAASIAKGGRRAA